MVPDPGPGGSGGTGFFGGGSKRGRGGDDGDDGRKKKPWKPPPLDEIGDADLNPNGSGWRLVHSLLDLGNLGNRPSMFTKGGNARDAGQRLGSVEEWLDGIEGALGNSNKAVQLAQRFSELALAFAHTIFAVRRAGHGRALAAIVMEYLVEQQSPDAEGSDDGSLPDMSRRSA